MSRTVNTSILSLTILLVCQGTVLITAPARNDFQNSTIPYSYANFGSVVYGKTMSFSLIKTPINLCESVKDFKHITEATYLLVDSSIGTCSYTTQSINAESLGAKGVIFVSDMVDYYGKVIQADDGNGRKVKITVLFINTNSYKKLQSTFNQLESSVQNPSIGIKVLFEVYKTEKVNMTYFLSASGRNNYIFLRDFQPYYDKIADYINFKPVYVTYSCMFCSEQDCLFDNQYCNFEMDKYELNVGKYVLEEQLRQWNIWKQSGTAKYLQYMNSFDQFCTVNWLSSESCGNTVREDLGIHGLTMKDSPTDVMDEWRVEEYSAGFISTPELTINEQLYGGAYDPESVFEDICANLISPPSECDNQEKMPSSKLAVIIVVILIACVISVLIGLFVYRRCVKKELTKDMFSKVNQLVAKYATKVSESNKKRKEKLTMSLNEQL